jgi:phosphopantothenoylcysteine decarboxylase / phosphopantothenate---cysteine ligase
MGFALAEELASRGAKVILVTGPVQLKTINKNIHRIDVVSAEEMNDQCLSVFPAVDGAVMCAAVADYMPTEKADKKFKRGEGNITIELKPTPDIAYGLGKIKSEKQLLIGFALETNNETVNALSKLNKKNLDFIVLNSLNDPGAGFQTDTNKITIIDKHNNLFKFELKTKEQVAVDIVDRIVDQMEL